MTDHKDRVWRNEANQNHVKGEKDPSYAEPTESEGWRETARVTNGLVSSYQRFTYFQILHLQN